MKNLAIIPARSGSKGLIDKNIKLLNGKPLISYSIVAAKDSEIFDEIYVSTDSKDYAKIAMECGASVPFLRSEINATDTANSWDVVREALSQYEELGRLFDTVTLLQPTTPFRDSDDIKEAYKILLKNHTNSVVSVCEVDHSPLWCNTLPRDYSMDNFIRKDISMLGRQKLDTFYRINGAIYMVKVPYFKTCKTIYDKNSMAYIMKKEKSIDIDDEFDFKLAAALIHILENEKIRGD